MSADRPRDSDRRPRAQPSEMRSATTEQTHSANADATVLFSQCIDGVWLHWTVTEIDTRDTPGSRRPHCLLFSRVDCIRRIWEYPANWRSLDAQELAALSWHR